RYIHVGRPIDVPDKIGTHYIHVGRPIDVPDKIGTRYIHVGRPIDVPDKIGVKPPSARAPMLELAPRRWRDDSSFPSGPSRF
ncbi:MAG: hypothetical protein ACREV5_18785, partial [Steroidobacter sp.]